MREFKLSEDGIDWAVGAVSGHIPYRNIRRLRMSYRPNHAIASLPHRIMG